MWESKVGSGCHRQTLLETSLWYNYLPEQVTGTKKKKERKKEIVTQAQSVPPAEGFICI